MIDFTKNYAPLIVKDIFKEIRSYNKQLERARKTELDNKSDARSVRSQRHWKASATVDLCLREIDSLYERLAVLDSRASWSHDLHQDRYKFTEKYPEIMGKYKEGYYVVWNV
ncbi:conserved hypothetical protein [Carnobacterium maltaromaticum]|nr:conserved hypothetical protein [Carnobacterium maltaromaticum]